ncbi:MAG: bifunctional folylpolyglutamate synthase/dihydrofolate synthase [Acidimicrobiales bacterium]
MPTRTRPPTLERIKAMCRLLGDPEKAIPVVHITGTNGKGSTAKMVTALLMANGLATGTYTSPNLSRVNERLARDNEPIDDEELVEVLGTMSMVEPMLGEQMTRFEVLTASAFWWFADIAVDVAVVEVGLGGTWDATNVVEPAVAAVTNVSYDHVEILGPTLEDIAREKAGIVKPGCRLVVGETHPELLEVFTSAAESAGVIETWVRHEEFDCVANRLAVGGRLLDLRTPGAGYEEVYLPIHGAHQGENAAVALSAAEAFFGFPLSEDVVREGMGSVEVPGRLEVVGREPLVVLDGAHNVAGAEALANALLEEFPSDAESVAVVGMLAGRDPSAMLQALASAGVGTVVACPAPSPRALPAGQIAEAARASGLSTIVADNTEEALSLATGRVSPEGRLIVTGSLYVVAEARAVLLPAASER